jgi:hypothetical protein
VTRLRLGKLAWSARALAFIVRALGVLVSASCTDARGALGEQCLKDQDCLSGICAQQLCAAAPPLLDGSTSAIGVPAGDALAMTSTDSSESADSPASVGDAQVDQGSPGDAEPLSDDVATANVGDAPGQSPVDAAADVPPEAKSQGAPEAAAEAAVDGRADALSAGGQPDSSADGAGGG